MRQQEYTDRHTRVACIVERSQLCLLVWFSRPLSWRTLYRLEVWSLFARMDARSFGPRAWLGAHPGARGHTALLSDWLPQLGLW